MKKSGQQAGNRPVRAGRGTGRADGKTSQGGARNSPGQKKGAGLPNLRDIPPSEQGKLNFGSVSTTFAGGAGSAMPIRRYRWRREISKLLTGAK